MRPCLYVREKCNFVYDVKELSLTLTEGHRKGVPGGNIWTYGGGSDSGLERIHNEELLVVSARCH
jgi:hypothetical protein